MGLDINGTKFLLYAHTRGVLFESTAMVGRQNLLVSPTDLAANFSRFGIFVDASEASKILATSFAEPFLGRLGAQEITSFDASDYEGASVVHDFNRPIPDEYKGKFSVVLDGGTLEHVFNFPVAIRNCMEMVRVGGHFLSIMPTNNQLGHGFYQFSPELLYRIFTPANGFEMQQMIIFEESHEGDWYEVSDPDVVKERVILINDEPSMLLVIAKKIAEAEIFAESPQQSDYSALWQANGSMPAASSNGHYAVLGSGATGAAIRGFKHFQRMFNRSFGMLNRRTDHFKKIDPTDKIT